MTQQQSEKRKKKAENEPLVISRTDDGFRVYSPAEPSKSYVVSGSPEAPSCTCPDFQYHQGDLQWRCKHILAAVNQLYKLHAQPDVRRPHGVDERSEVQKEGRELKQEEVPTMTNSVPDAD